MHARSLLLVPALALFANLVHAEEWAIDAAHTRVGFTVPHMVVSDVEGRFHDVKGKVDIDDKDPTKSVVEITIQAGSVDTANADRDKHLKSPDFFDVAKFPTITFKSTKISKVGKNKYKVTGDLTIRDVTKSVVLDVEASDAIQNPWGKQVRGVKVAGKVNRHDFGLNWNKTLDKGGVLVGDIVTLDVQFELDK
ncbi:MAG TPA: YceI family protein [Polyangiaceae bacterium]|nr:YceI family protein [Polyangiaceae bacterium]